MPSAPRTENVPHAPSTPIFTYGLLRPGNSIYNRILTGKTLEEHPAILHGANLHDGNGLPILIPGDGTVIGDVLYLTPTTQQATLDHLDTILGARHKGDPTNTFERIPLDVMIYDGTMETAWTYVAGTHTRIWTATQPVVASGNWATHMTA